MKLFMVAMMMMGFVGTAAVAADASMPEVKVLSQDTIQDLGLEEGVTESEEWAGSQCAAVFQCRSGRVIGCTASGIVTSCNRGGGRVVCQAWGSNGSYSRASDFCR